MARTWSAKCTFSGSSLSALSPELLPSSSIRGPPLMGIAGSFVATYLGQAFGWYQAGEGAGLIGAVVGAIIVLVIWGIFAPRQPTTIA